MRYITKCRLLARNKSRTEVGKHGRRIIRSSIIYLVSLAALESSVSAQEASSFAVLDLEARGVSQVEAASLSDRLRAAMVRTKKATIVERGLMEQILSEQDFNLSGCTSDECAVVVGQLLGVTNMVAGSVGKVGSTYSVDIRVIDVVSGQINNSLSKDHQGQIDGLLGLMTVIANELVAEVTSEAVEEVIPEPEPEPVAIPIPPPVVAPVIVPPPPVTITRKPLRAREIYNSLSSFSELQTITAGDSVYIISYQMGRCIWSLGHVVEIDEARKNRFRVEIDGRVKTVNTKLTQILIKPRWLLPYVEGFGGRALSRGDYVIAYSYRTNSLSKATVESINKNEFVSLSENRVVRGIRKTIKSQAHISALGLILGGLVYELYPDTLSETPQIDAVAFNNINQPSELAGGEPSSAREIWAAVSLKELQTIAVGDSVYIISYKMGQCTWELGHVLDIEGAGKNRIRVEVAGKVKRINTKLSQLLRKTHWLVPYVDGFGTRALSVGNYVIGYSYRTNSLSKAVVKGITPAGFVTLEGSKIERGIRKSETTQAHISAIGLMIDLE